jgi:hypothetical protein
LNIVFIGRDVWNAQQLYELVHDGALVLLTPLPCGLSRRI